MRDAAGQPKRRADRQHVVADLHRIAVAELQGRELHVLGVQDDDRHIGPAIRANALRRELSAVLQVDDRRLRPFDDVVVRHDDAGGIDEKARTEPEPLRLARHAAELFRQAGIIER